MRMIFLILTSLLFCTSTVSYAEEGTPVPVKVIKQGGLSNGPLRTPIVVPSIYKSGRTLFFHTPCDGYTLYLTDVEGNVCYETVVPYGAEELTLPEYLSGEYEIILSNGSCDFVGSIII